MITQEIVTCLVLCACLSSISAQNYNGAECTTRRGRQGVCRTYANCPQATRDVKKGIRPRICGFVKKESFVCCTGDETPLEERRKSDKMCWQYSRHVYKTSQVPTLLPEPSYVNDTDCAQSGQELLVGGVAAAPKEFPHMVNLGYGNEDAIVWKCGASLISERWLLTAAHCISDNSSPVRWARLGDLDLDSEADSAQPQTIRIEQRVPHPEYKPPALYNDIALLKLATDVPISSWVRPACLDTDPLTPTGDKATATGWGIAEYDAAFTSKVLMKVTLPYRSKNKCNETYQQLINDGKSLKRGIDEASMICAGDERAGRDICSGDTGGPLQKKIQQPLCMYSLVGVTSFGVTSCVEGDNPALFTRVSHYLPWIEENVWPEEE